MEIVGGMIGLELGERLLGNDRSTRAGAATRAMPTVVPNTRVLFRRVCSFVANFLLVVAGYYLLFGVGRLSFVPFLLGVLVVFLLYRVAFEATTGRTPAKALFRIRVVAAGRPHHKGVAFYQSVVRNILLVVDLALMSSLLGLLIPFLSDRRQRVGDFGAGTLVVGEKARPRRGEASTGARNKRQEARGL